MSEDVSLDEIKAALQAELAIRRATERNRPCPGAHPDRPDLHCVHPDGHVVHWDGDRELWLSPTVADDMALAAAEARGRAWAVAALRARAEEVFHDEEPLMAVVQGLHLRRAADYLVAIDPAKDRAGIEVES